MDLISELDQLARHGWWIVRESSFFLLAGFLAAGLLKHALPKDYLSRFLGRRSFGSVVMAALIGAPLPLCSCGVIGAAVGLRKSGASRGAVQSFLISTPETGVDSIAITYAIMGPFLAVVRPIAAVLTAIIAGGMELVFGVRDEPVPAETPVVPAAVASVETDESVPAYRPVSAESATTSGARPRRRSVWRFGADVLGYSFVEMPGELGKYLVIGFVLAAFVMALLPDGFFLEGAGPVPALPPLVWMVILLVLSVPMYVCATSSTPMAAVLILKGLSPGAALVFLLAGPATNIATMLIVGKQLGRRSLGIYLTTIVFVSIGLGLLVDAVWAGWVTADTTARVNMHVVPEEVEIAGAILLAAMLGYALVAAIARRLAKRKAQAAAGDSATETKTSCADGCC